MFGKSGNSIGFRLGILLAVFFIGAARAEPPMHVDDAGTLDKGGLKIESALSRDDKTRGGELIFGFAPIEDVEVGLSVARETDRAGDPATRNRVSGIGFKWVPIQNDNGWSLGASFGWGNTRVHMPSAAPPDLERYTSKEFSWAGLATYRFENSQVFHLNLGSTRTKEISATNDVGTWGLGYEFPLQEKLKLTAEVFGEEQKRPDKALGLRYEVAEGLKVSGAVGRGNNRSFGQVGFSWEF